MSAVKLGAKTLLSLFYIQSILFWSITHNSSLRGNPEIDHSTASSSCFLIEKDSENFLSRANLQIVKRAHVYQIDFVTEQ